MAINMGIGLLGSPSVTIKRKNRFTFRIFGFCRNEKNVVPEHFVRTATRPQFEFEEVQLDHLNGRTWIPGKMNLSPMTVTYYDVAHEQNRYILSWIATMYNFLDVNGENDNKYGRMGEKIDWNATGVLSHYDGCGGLIEQWTMRYMFPNNVEFGELDAATSEPCEISLTLRYSDFRYKSFCPQMKIDSCCTGCTA